MTLKLRIIKCQSQVCQFFTVIFFSDTTLPVEFHSFRDVRRSDLSILYSQPDINLVRPEANRNPPTSGQIRLKHESDDFL